MMRIIAVLSFAIGFPAIALADLNATVTLTANTSINLETGATPGSPVDLLWNGATLTPQGNATHVLLYDDVEENLITFITSLQIQFTPGYNKTPITPALGDLIGVRTNGNHTVRLYIKAKSGNSITLKFTTFGVPQTPGGGTEGPPTITSVLNNSSHIPDGLPNSGISPSSLFIVVGSGLANPGTPTLPTEPKFTLPRSRNGAVITVNVGSFTQDTPIYYTSPTQLAGVLPAATPIGNGTITVKYNGVASNAFAIKVIAAAPGLTVYNGNTAVVQDAINYSLITITNPAKSGQYITIWMDGLGADPLDSDTTYTDTPHAINTPTQVYIGNVQVTNIAYQGASVYPGVPILVVQIPNGVPDGCWVSLSVVAGGVVSNSATIPIRAAGGACVDNVTNFSTSQLTAGGTGTIRTGFVSLVQTRDVQNGVPTTTNAANAVFRTYTGVFTPSNQVSPGTCIVNDLTPVSTTNTTGLTSGTITLTGPNALSVQLASQLGIQGAYFSLLSNTAIPNAGGTFTFTGAAGGANVGPFSTNVVFTGPLFSWTNTTAVATVNRAAGFTVTWTGGTPGSWVFITGNSVVPGGTISAGFTCMAPVAAGSFQVPGYILLALPAGNGGVNVQNYTYSTLTATGLDIAYAFGDISISANGVFQ